MRSKIWIGVGMAVAAGTVASAQPFDAPVLDDAPAALGWQLAAGQGGEGGEAAVSTTAGEITDAALSEKLAEIAAHLWLAQTLKNDKDGAAAAEVLKHALENLYPQVAPGLAVRKIAPLEAELMQAVDMAAKSQDGSTLEAAELANRLNAAETAVAPDAAHAAERAAALVAGLAKSAAVEYGEAIADGKIKELAEYRYAAAFVRLAGERLIRAEAALVAKDAKATTELVDGLKALGATLRGLDALDGPMLTPAEFSAIASRLELKASRFAN